MKNNFVAKHCRTFNKATTHRDRTKYTRPNQNWLNFIEPPLTYCLVC